MKVIHQGNSFIFVCDNDRDIKIMSKISSNYGNDISYRGDTKECMMSLISKYKIDNPDGNVIYERVHIKK